MLFICALGCGDARACENAFVGRIANDRLGFVRVSNGAPVELDGILNEILNARPARARFDAPGSPPFAMVVMNDDAASWVFPAGAHLIDDPGVLSDYLLESAAFHALRARYPGEAILLTLVPARHGSEAAR